MITEVALPFADAIPPDVAADTQAILDKLMTGKPLDPGTVARIRGEAARIREEIHRRHGVLDIGVPAIRELRDA